MRILEAKNPRWSNKEKTAIDIDVNFERIPEQFVVFTATQSDTTSYGRELYSLAKAGKLGVIQ